MQKDMVISMENKLITGRLAALRTAMKNSGIDFYMMPTADFHSSEYVSAYFKVREYFCNFSGSNGTLLVWQEGAGLWTDGRYFIQAENELRGTGVELFRMLDEGVPAIGEFLQANMKDGQALGFDGRVICARDGRKYEKLFSEAGKKIRYVYDKDLAEGIWQDRPAFPIGRITAVHEDVAGKSVEDKLREVREKISAQGAESLLLTKLDELMWLFNIRGCDVECNPVAMSYGYITQEEAVLFVQKSALDPEAKACLLGHRVILREYHEIAAFLEELPKGGKVLADDRYCSYMLYKILEQRQEPSRQELLVGKKNPTELLKAVKNPVELSHMEDIFLKDSVAVTKFIYWLKTNIGRIEITEVSAAGKLEQFRREIPEYLGPSFPTIAGYGANAAMMHYEAAAESCAVLAPGGMLLVDSGGQYTGGTTDVTRTIVLGDVCGDMKIHYTAVAAGMLRLSMARWIHGCTGRNLDILARQPIWNMGLDYKCGTGHGVGYMLNVHEGPQNMRWRFAEGAAEAVLEEGMDITNEPGIYVEGSHGVRIENVMVAKNDVKNEYGQFMHFDTLTWVPLDMDGILEQNMTETDRAFLYLYQRRVYDKISPFLNEEEREWLRRETRADSTFFLHKGENAGGF